MRGIDFTGLVYLGGGALVLFALWKMYQALPAAGAAVADALAVTAAKVNPFSDQNFIYTAASSKTDSGSVGAAIWELTHPGAVAAESAALAPSADSLSTYWAQFTDPNYIDRMAAAEKLTAFKNIKVPVKNDAGAAWIAG